MTSPRVAKKPPQKPKKGEKDISGGLESAADALPSRFKYESKGRRIDPKKGKKH